MGFGQFRSERKFTTMTSLSGAQAPTCFLQAIAVRPAEPLAIIDEIEAANGGNIDLTFGPQLNNSEDFLQQRPASILSTVV